MIYIRGLLGTETRHFLQRNICVSWCYYENHYEVLKLQRNCTQRDIKNSFIKLSKQYHPDKNTDNNTHNKFVKLNEAYSVLSRPKARRDYDLTLVPPDFAVRRPRRVHYETDFSSERPFKPFRDNSFWENRDRSKDNENMRAPYYGIKGLRRVPNSWILTFLFLFTVIGVGFQVMLIRSSAAFSRRALEERSARNSEIERQLRERNQQTRDDTVVLEKLMNQSNAQKTASESSPKPED